MARGQVADLLGLAIAHGYYDQNHFIKEFKYFTHHTPTQQDTLWDPNIHWDARQLPTCKEGANATVLATRCNASPLRWL
jgi:AraC-like DNA-binding protein